ncbi:MAG TPA: phospholipase [Ruminococcaceae bacterium]|nr:phospholipase [Oscillospiraceae bacterium]
MKTAVVLGGGGARGAYQIGVWQALRELDIEYHIVTGTSVGALNGALMVLGEYDKAKEMWEKLTNDTVVRELPSDVDYESYLGKREIWAKFIKTSMENGGMDTAPLEELISSIVDEELFLRSSIEFGLVTVEYPTFKPLQIVKSKIPKGMLKYYLLASAACFPAFKAVSINEGRFIDGGYANNLPIDLAIECGADNVIAVDIKGLGIVKKIRNNKVPIKTIAPQWDLGPILIFEPETAKKNMRLGYLEAMKAFGKYDGGLYTFDKGELALLAHNMLAQYSANVSVLLNLMAEKNNAPFEYLLWRKITRLCGCTSGKIELKKVIEKSAELAMRIFELSPCNIYTAKTSVSLLCDEFKKLAIILPQDIELQFKTQISAKAIADSLRLIDKKAITSYICELARKALLGEKPAVSLALLFSVFTDEAAAALFILTANETAYKNDKP